MWMPTPMSDTLFMGPSFNPFITKHHAHQQPHHQQHHSAHFDLASIDPTMPL